MEAPIKPKLFILSGASGTGKTTLCRALESQLGLYFSISATTRPARPGEVSGRDYHFLAMEDFFQLRDQAGLLEWAKVHGNFYGTLKEPIQNKLDEGVSVLLDLDTQGALKLKQERGDVVLIFIRAPSSDTLRERLEKRGTDSPEIIEGRIKKAAEEIAESPKYDHVLINQDLKETEQSLIKIIKSYG